MVRPKDLNLLLTDTRLVLNFRSVDIDDFLISSIGFGGALLRIVATLGVSGPFDELLRLFFPALLSDLKILTFILLRSAPELVARLLSDGVVALLPTRGLVSGRLLLTLRQYFLSLGWLHPRIVPHFPVVILLLIDHFRAILVPLTWIPLVFSVFVAFIVRRLIVLILLVVHELILIRVVLSIGDPFMLLHLPLASATRPLQHPESLWIVFRGVRTIAFDHVSLSLSWVVFTNPNRRPFPFLL